MYSELGSLDGALLSDCHQALNLAVEDAVKLFVLAADAQKVKQLLQKLWSALGAWNALRILIRVTTDIWSNIIGCMRYDQKIL